MSRIADAPSTTAGLVAVGPVTWPRTAGLATALGAVLFLAGQAALPVLPDVIDDAFPLMLAHRDQLMAARLLTSAGCFLLTVAGVAFATLLARGTKSRTVMVGGVLVAIGSFFNAVSQAVQGYAAFAATRPDVDAASGRTMLEHLTDGAVGFPISFASVPAFALGCLVVAVGIARRRAMPIWVPGVLAIGTVMAGALAGRGPIVALTQAPLTLAFIVLAVQLARRPATG